MTFLPYEQGKIACLCGGRSWPLVDDRERSRSGTLVHPLCGVNAPKAGGTTWDEGKANEGAQSSLCPAPFLTLALAGRARGRSVRRLGLLSRQARVTADELGLDDNPVGPGRPP